MGEKPICGDAASRSRRALRDALENERFASAQMESALNSLLSLSDRSPVNDRVLAGIHGMADDIAKQLLQLVPSPAAPSPGVDRERPSHRQEREELALALMRQPGLRQFLHMFAIEAQLVARLDRQVGCEPVLSPLLESLMASHDRELAELARRVFSAQSSFMHHTKRFQMPLGELPADLLDSGIESLTGLVASQSRQGARERAAQSLRSVFREGRSRLALIARLLHEMGEAGSAALRLPHAGVGLFFSAMATLVGVERHMVALATSEDQYAHLTVMLDAAGLNLPQIREQLVTIHPNLIPSEDIAPLGSVEARQLLAALSGTPLGTS